MKLINRIPQGARRLLSPSVLACIAVLLLAGSSAATPLTLTVYPPDGATVPTPVTIEVTSNTEILNNSQSPLATPADALGGSGANVNVNVTGTVTLDGSNIALTCTPPGNTCVSTPLALGTHTLSVTALVAWPSPPNAPPNYVLPPGASSFPCSTNICSSMGCVSECAVITAPTVTFTVVKAISKCPAGCKDGCIYTPPKEGEPPVLVCKFGLRD